MNSLTTSSIALPDAGPLKPAPLRGAGEPAGAPRLDLSATLTGHPVRSPLGDPLGALVTDPAIHQTAARQSATGARGLGSLRGALGRLSGRLLTLGLCVLIWQVATSLRLDLGVLTFRNVPGPGEVAGAAAELARSPVVLQHLGASLGRVFAGFTIAAVLGIVLGAIIGRARWAQFTLLTPLEVLRPIPAVAWIPLAILMFPSSEASMIFITFVGALFPVLLNTIHGVQSVDPRLIASARGLGAGRLALVREVMLPSALPSIITGLAIGMGTAWFCLVTAEMISGQFGIGYYTWMSYTIQNYADIVVGMLLIGALGMASSTLVRAVGNLLMPWRARGAS